VKDSEIADVLDRLVGPLEDETGDWDDVVKRSAPVPATRRSSTVRRPGRRSRRARVALLVGTVLAGAVLALTVASPWKAGPSALDRAAAAIDAPTSDHVLRQSIALRAGPFNRRGAVNVHVWVSSAPPRRFRVTFVGLDGPVEYGGTLGDGRGLGYDAAGGVLDPIVFDVPLSESDLDPVAFVRTALASGRARPDGSTTIHGHKALRIRILSSFSSTGEPAALYFVDAQSYRPVRVVIPAGFRPGPPPGARPGTVAHDTPLLSLVLGAPQSGPMSLRYALTYDFAAYRYLAPTSENQKLADIHAEHPHAKIL
jgi:hypothetical protein